MTLTKMTRNRFRLFYDSLRHLHSIQLSYDMHCIPTDESPLKISELTQLACSNILLIAKIGSIPTNHKKNNLSCVNTSSNKHALYWLVVSTNQSGVKRYSFGKRFWLLPSQNEGRFGRLILIKK